MAKGKPGGYKAGGRAGAVYDRFPKVKGKSQRSPKARRSGRKGKK